MISRDWKLRIYGICLLWLSVSVYASPEHLYALTDHELADIHGQSLMSLTYIAPTDSENRMSSSNIGFYKIGMEADLNLNANIRSLQLGCGRINGNDGCDIDIDYVSLSGISDTRDGRASSSALLTNPFVEFAIKNPNSASTREIAGVRFSAEKVVGLLTLGLENSASPSGINSLSGYLKVQSGIGDTIAEQSKVKGYASTDSAYMNLANYPINGKLLALNLATASFKTIGGGFNIPEMDNLPFETPQMVVNGRRQSNVFIQSSVTIPTINLGKGTNFPTSGRTVSNSDGTTTAVYTAGHPVNAQITGCTNTVFIVPACLVAPTGRQFSGIEMTGQVSGAKAQVNLTEGLGFIHKLALNTAASLSLQSIAIAWPGADLADVAQAGWWLSMQDPVNIGRVQPTQRLSIIPLLGQFAERAGAALNANPATTSDLGAVISGSGLAANIGNINLSTAPALQMNLSNLQLNGQDFAPNCYGTMKFC